MPTELAIALSRLVGRTGVSAVDDLTPAQVLAILSGQAGAAFSWNSQELNAVGKVLINAAGRLRIPVGPDRFD